MARYASYLTVKPPKAEVSQLVGKLLSQHGLSITYSTDDYVMAQETVGSKPYNQLVKVEVLIHKSDMQQGIVKLTCVCKNGELQLQNSNHCQQVADQLLEAFRDSQQWSFVEQLNE